jgi:serine/threonine-protein kinase
MTNFRRIKKLGEGGMGEVWLVMDEHSRALFAQKTLRMSLARDKDRARFNREIAALQVMSHPNVVKIHTAVVPLLTLGPIRRSMPVAAGSG